MLTQPGIPNEYTLSTTCYGSRLGTIEDQAFAAVAMGFRRLELGLLESPVKLNGFEDSHRETGICVRSIVSGCLDPSNGTRSGTHLGSLSDDQREIAVSSLRRHVRLAQRYNCPVVIVRGCQVEDRGLREEADRLRARIVREGVTEDVQQAARELVARAQTRGQRQVDLFCRSLHTVLSEQPGVKIAVETGDSLLDLLSFHVMGWVLEDLSSHGLAYWHDTGRIHLRERVGLPGQGAWLDAYARHMVGVHLDDAADGTSDMPPGTGEVDFKLVADYLPSSAERVIEVNQRHGRGEILAAVQFLVDRKF